MGHVLLIPDWEGQIVDANDREIYKNSLFLGQSTNNVASAGFWSKVSSGNGYTQTGSVHRFKISCQDDVVNPILKLYHEEALRLLSQFQQVVIQWISREQSWQRKRLT